MFSQDHDFPDDVSEGEIEAEAGNESSDDDDLKRVLRHIGGIDEKVAEEDDFEKCMEDELDNTVKSLEKNRGSHPDSALLALTSSAALHEQAAKSLILAPSGSSTAPASSSNGPSVSTSETKPKKAVQFTEKPAEFYDDIYFDSDDEERESSLKQNGSRATKKHPVLSNAELFYDPKVDDEDQRWVDDQRRKYHPRPKIPVESEGSASSSASPIKRKSKEKAVPTTDAVLNCPACMTTICLDCQRHEVYQQQYRAMFVLNCSVDKTRTLICKAKKQQQKKRRMTDSEPDEFVAIDSGATGSTAKEDTFYPVKCVECNTEVGVIDSEEVYHFFNVIASHP